MLQKVNPQQTSRKASFDYLSEQVMPMVSLIKRIDITRLIKLSKKKGYKLNCLMNYAIIKASLGIKEFWYFVDGKTKELFIGDEMVASVVVKRKDGGIAFCKVKFNEDYGIFSSEYDKSQKYCYENNCNKEVEGCAIIGTSTIPWTTLTGAVNGYGPTFTNPFIVIPKYEKKWGKYYVQLSFQFHHLQMDGEHGCRYLESLQKTIRELKV